ncbi:TerD family protein [Butyrivibrio sp. AC2005]|uniref:TerD family protein n=1 Tax=Butyrivibrio sp. AC2005 TaxID=1280672 RepID=UPI00041EC7DA|nr:TerD family protein [Butyrivibrio sp. AC2005]
MSADKNISGIVLVQFGWNAYSKQRSGGLISGILSGDSSIDCDSRAIFCKKNGKPVSMNVGEACLYYGNADMFASSAIHFGDNKTGGAGVDEQMQIDLDKIPESVDEIVFTLDLFKEKKKIGAGKIQESYIKIIDKSSGEEKTRGEIKNLSSNAKIVTVGRLQRNGGKWNFVSDGTMQSVNNIEDYLCQM